MKNSKLKKILTATILAVAVVLSTVISAVVVVKHNKDNFNPVVKEKIWDGKTTIKPTGDGCEDDPFIIESGENLAYVAQEMTFDNFYYFSVVKDINLGGHDWTPIGSSSSKMFTGMFMGNGFTISNIGETQKGYYESSQKQAPSLFGFVRSAVIDGVFVRYSFGEAVNTPSFGGIAKKALDNVYISKCANLTPSLTFKKVNSRYGYGGLVGYAEKGLTISESFSVTNINFNGKANAIGGLVGYYTYGGNTIKNSYSAGKITISDDSTVAVGNIVGSGHYADASISKVDYSNVYSIFDDKDSETNPGDKWSKLLETGNWVVDPDVNNGMPVVKVVEKNLSLIHI